MANQIIISDASADFDQFRANFEDYLKTKSAWKGNLTTMTGQTLIELVSALGAFDQAKIMRAYQDAFTETAVSDDAIRACAIMQGVRMTRKTPAQITAQLTAPRGLVIPAYSQFECAGYTFFNRDAIEFATGEEDTSTMTVLLFQGEVQSFEITGNGKDLQAWISNDDNFTVSDRDVAVWINDESIPISYAGLWNFRGQPACMDLTTSSGRLILQFGTSKLVSSDESIPLGEDEVDLTQNLFYGSVPGINDVVKILYATTQGESGNNYVTLNKEISIDGFASVSGKAMGNPIYGANEKSTLTYKNNTASSFGTYGSAVTKAQYSAIVNTYPGVIDAITQSQREINPAKLEYMNVIWVTGVTNEPWDELKKQEFCEWCQNQSMYSTRFVWVDATEVKRTVSIRCYCYNSATLTDVEANVKNAINALFEPRPGILMTDIYRSDIINAALKSDANISYVILDEPSADCIVTQPNAPILSFTVNEDDHGTIEPLQYSYCVSFINAEGVESMKNNWVHPLIKNKGETITLTWKKDDAAVKYRIYGRSADSIGLMEEVGAETLTYKDDGSKTPDPDGFTKTEYVELKYNSLNKLDSLFVTAEYTDRQQRLENNLPYRSNS